jgi:NAD(P)-dependent dehydrogenase (short-subunit alcohol dehydrogenase family)
MKIVVIGGTGTIGTEVVRALDARHAVVRACRTTAEACVNIESPASIRALFQAIGTVDAVVCAAGDARFGPMDGLSEDDHAVGIASKLMGQVNLARLAVPHVHDGGSITLTAGVTGRRPIPGTTSVGLINSAIEGYVRAAAMELPRGIRINAVSPNWTIESLALFGMDTSWGVPAATVALGYVASVEGDFTGTVIDAGWQHDPGDRSKTVAAA